MARGILRIALLLIVALAGISGAGATGREFRDCPDCPRMVTIPAGRFVMGSPRSERERFDTEGPRHPVAVRAFALGATDVTVEQFGRFVADSGYDAGACDWPQGLTWRSAGPVHSPRLPVVCVSWRDAQAYIDWLNRRVPGGGYRLPSEAEWEYAARAGTATARWWGQKIGVDNANCNGCGSRWDDKGIAPVDGFRPNPFGLYQMLGNVWQWTQDCWNESYVGAPGDGGAWLHGDCTRRVVRGGSWSNLPEFVRSAARSGVGIGDRDHDYSSYTGFRVAKTLR